MIYYQQGPAFKCHLSGLTDHKQPRDSKELFRLLDLAQSNQKHTVCVIEDIVHPVAEDFIRLYGVGADFFKAHNEGPQCADHELWQRKGWHNPLKRPGEQLPPWQQLLGLFEYHDRNVARLALESTAQRYLHRPIFESETYHLSASTVVTYIRVSPFLYLFLVDSPRVPNDGEYNTDELSKTYLHPTLRFPYAGNRGGLLIPRFRNQEICSPIQVLANAFAHRWQLDAVFSTSYTFPNVPLIYLLSNSTWESVFRDLDRRIKHFCLQEMRVKGRGLIGTLHDLREELQALRVSLDETILYTIEDVQPFYLDLRDKNPDINMRWTPIDGLSSLKKSTDQLHTFFVENIQLLLGIISIQDAQHNATQTHKATMLTALATVYLPISLAASVFGMNLREMNGDGPSVWVFVVTCVTLFLCTGFAVLVAFKPVSANPFDQPDRTRRIFSSKKAETRVLKADEDA